MKEVKIESIQEYVKEIVSIEQRAINPLRNMEILFRGLSDSGYDLKPSIDRRPLGTSWETTLQLDETELVQSACKKYPRIFDVNDQPVMLLAKLQHYGIPTRMMDVTSNALVALYFACQEKQGNEDKPDGVVYVFQGDVISPFNPFINAIADTYRLTRNAYIDVETYLYKLKQQDYFKPILFEETRKGQLLDLLIKMIKKPLFVDVGNFCERQVHQQGKFIIFPNLIEEHCSESNLSETVYVNDLEYKMCDELVEVDKESIDKKIVIKSNAKSDILEQLKRLGISKEYLFADSIDIVCGEIKAEILNRFTK